jgi:deoxyribodipyrimidine photo-lyase
MIALERIQPLNSLPLRPGRFVLYWMQQSVRSRYNHALEYAVRQANAQRLPVVALFGLTDRYPEANERHYAFLLEGLRDTQEQLRERGIRLVVKRQSPEEAAVEMAQQASEVVTDRGYLRIQRQWRRFVAYHAPCRVTQVESDLIVPLETASPKEEWAAATLRPKIQRQLSRFLVPLEPTPIERDSLGVALDGLDTLDVDATLASLEIDRSVPRVYTYRGGETEARRRLTEFIQERLQGYATLRNEPSLDHVSRLSPYLHFGQISPLEIALVVADSPHVADREAFLEELIVRRELSANFVFYNPAYDRYEGLPEWSRRTLDSHRADPRPYLYSREELERAQTHDPYWNAAMREMILTGKMHNYMRMYWGKKILEWSATPEEAFRTALALNNRWFLDGRDPNSFAGVAWCFGKHDRPWTERPVFGTVRYMNAAGLKRKFDIEGYVRRIDALESAQ